MERKARHRAFVPGERAEIRDRAVGVVVPDADEVVRAAGREERALRRNALALREVRVGGDRSPTRCRPAAAAAPGQILHAVPEHEALVASRDQGGHRAGRARQAPVASARERGGSRARCLQRELARRDDHPTSRLRVKKPRYVFHEKRCKKRAL